ncbi:hypothetical protein AB0D91_46970 [Streptomyces canus]|uniref:hypothetical protein n=1 Tax=Streptomyces canus TaxID=58343 RepID=UPI0033F3AEBF
MHNEDAVGFITARRFAPNRPYRVTFNGGVHGPGDNAYCQAAMPPAHLRLLDVISVGESTVAYQGCGDGREGEEVFWLALVAAVESSVA